MKPGDKTPVERVIEMLKQGLDMPTICFLLEVSEWHGRRLASLARREIEAERDYRRDYNQRYNLPAQLAAARAKFEALERKAARLGLHDIVQGRAA